MLRAACCAALLSTAALAQVRVNVNVDLASYFHQPPQQVLVLEQSRIPDEERPVVLFLAERAHQPPAVIWAQRQRGMRWCDIGLRYGLGGDVFHVALNSDPGPVYGPVYGYYRRVPQSQWRTMRLDDRDIVNLVNLRFYSEHYGYAPERVAAWRTGGESFVRIHEVANHEGWRDRRAESREFRKDEHERSKERRQEWKERRKEEREDRRDERHWR